MKWTVRIPKRVDKQIEALPKPAQEAFFMLLYGMEKTGAVQGVWPNYSKLSGNRHHCHIRKGRPCYVVVWEVMDNKIRIIEVIYAGTHENAPY